jgi:UDP-glucose 4-epimerase
MENSNSHPVILVTGGRGLLGSYVVPLLAKNQGVEVIVVARGPASPSAPELPVKTITGDLRDATLWARLPDTITHVVHLAAFIPWKPEDKNRARIVIDNLTPLAHLIEHSQRWPHLAQVIYSSSVSVYAPSVEILTEDSPKRPQSLYGAAKLAGEQLLKCCEARNVATVSLRLSSLYAPGQYEGTVLPIMVNRAMQKQELLVFGDGARTQDFLHCEDAARAVLLCFQKRARGTYNVGSGTAVTMLELAETVNRVCADGQVKIVQGPGTDDDPGIRLDVSKARRDLDFHARFQLEEGLRHLQLETGRHRTEGSMEERSVTVEF